MTDEQIEQLAQRVARIILDQLHEGLILDISFPRKSYFLDEKELQSIILIISYQKLESNC